MNGRSRLGRLRMGRLRMGRRSRSPQRRPYWKNNEPKDEKQVEGCPNEGRSAKNRFGENRSVEPRRAISGHMGPLSVRWVRKDGPEPGDVHTILLRDILLRAARAPSDSVPGGGPDRKPNENLGRMDLARVGGPASGYLSVTSWPAVDDDQGPSFV